MSFLQPSSVNILAPLGRVIVDPTEVAERLVDLHETLSQELLLEANMRGYEARLEVTAAHPPTAAGTLHWHEFVGALRTELMRKDWIKRDHKNCPFIISPDKYTSILVMTGDADTGVVDGYPTNQADKGTVLNEAVIENSNYDLFENAALRKLNKSDSGTQLWVLLYHVERTTSGEVKKIRTELSLPSAFHKKKIVGWAERIILRTVELDGTSDVVHVEPTGPIDIPVERRSAG